MVPKEMSKKVVKKVKTNYLKIPNKYNQQILLTIVFTSNLKKQNTHTSKMILKIHVVQYKIISRSLRKTETNKKYPKQMYKKMFKNIFIGQINFTKT